ncbi:glycosyltransferase family 2 protein [Henriciella mobilis]|nr:glycosyltransferase family 2 protein [Henriciella mobilis]RIJ25750.1 glycosyltransferase family 2 protein [Henriciella mobilis]
MVLTALDHLRHQSRLPDEVIVVDNASTDGSADRIDFAGLPNAKLVRLERNIGFAGANNLAAEMATGDWLALLNPDTECQPAWLDELLHATKRHTDVSMFASAQYDAANPGLIDGAGDCYFVLGIPWRGGFGRKAEDMPGEGECFSPCGAGALFRREAFLRAGGFDENFFCYCEDVDLGFRLRLRGERCIFVPQAVLLHHGSAITGRYSDFTVRLGTRNRLRTYLINMPPLALALTLPGHVLATLYLYLRAFGKDHAYAMRRGLQEALATLPSTLRRRRVVQKSRTKSSAALMRAMSWNPATLHGRRPHVWHEVSKPERESPSRPAATQAAPHLRNEPSQR